MLPEYRGPNLKGVDVISDLFEGLTFGKFLQDTFDHFR